MGSKKKRKSLAAGEEEPAKRAGASNARRSSTGGGSNSPLLWSAQGVTVTLPHKQALLFVGRASLTVQSGEVSVSGSTLTAASGSTPVCADERCSGALLLEPGAALGTVPLATSGTVVFTLTRAADSSQSPLHPDFEAAKATSGSASSTGTSSRQLGFEVWLSGDPSAAVAAPPLLPPLWQQAVGELEESLAQQAQQGGPAPLIVVCGAKKVGKSTFARFLVNSLLNKHPCVGYLDIDCGQPEFTAPGLVSLSLLRQPVLGPAHMHQHRPEAAYFVGDTSPAVDPVRYLQYIRHLYRSWAAVAAGAASRVSDQQQQQQQQLPPLVVNTHGWVKGMGFDVLLDLLAGLPVTHMVQIAAANPKKNLPPGCFWLSNDSQNPQQQQQQQAEPALWLLPGLGGDQEAAQPAASEASGRSAATQGRQLPELAAVAGGAKGRLHAVEQRALQWEALAQQCIDRCGVATATPVGSSKAAAAAAAAVAAAGIRQGDELGDRLAAAVPFEIDVDDIDVQVLHSSVPPGHLFHALNGAVVGLCTPATPAQQQPLPATGSGLSTQQPLPLPCLGLGIVRAADAQQRRLHILTPVPEGELESVRVLQLGRLELPASLLQTGAHLSPYLCLHSLSSTGTGAGAIKSRNNLLRQSQA